MKREISKAILTFVGAVSLSASMAWAQDSSQSHEAMRAAFDACATQVGLQKPAAGERPQAPTEEQRQKMDACLKAKGFEPPAHRGGPHGPPPDGSAGGEQGSGGVQ